MKIALRKIVLSRWTERFLLAGGVWIIAEIIARCLVLEIQDDPFMAGFECLMAGLLVSPMVTLGRELLLDE